jgi:hypothetical protein
LIILFSTTQCFAQTKEKTVKWIKEKIEKYPGIYHFDFNDGSSQRWKTTINGYDVTTIYTVITSKKSYGTIETRIITMQFILYDIIFNSAIDPTLWAEKETTIGFIMPTGKVKYSHDNFPQDNYWWRNGDDGHCRMVLYWKGDYDLFIRMIKALNTLSDFNKPHETY